MSAKAVAAYESRMNEASPPEIVGEATPDLAGCGRSSFIARLTRRCLTLFRIFRRASTLVILLEYVPGELTGINQHAILSSLAKEYSAPWSSHPHRTPRDGAAYATASCHGHLSSPLRRR